MVQAGIAKSLAGGDEEGSEEAKDRLAQRQARAAIALVRMGDADEVWPLLRHSADPRLRSFIVNWLNPLGADPRRILDFRSRILDSTDMPVAELGARDPKSKIQNQKSKIERMAS